MEAEDRRVPKHCTTHKILHPIFFPLIYFELHQNKTFLFYFIFF